MSEFSGLWKPQYNQACTENVRVFRVLKIDTTRKKKMDTIGRFSEAGLHE